MPERTHPSSISIDFDADSPADQVGKIFISASITKPPVISPTSIPGAMWEDFKVGMEHLTRWERVAVVTDVEWIKHTMRFFSFLMPGTMKLFLTSEETQAREWIAS